MSDPIISRGFRGRRRDDGGGDRIPPGQYETDDFPVLSAGPTPRTPLDAWDFTIIGEVDELRVGPGRSSARFRGGDHGRHPLRHEVVEAGHGLGGRRRGHAA